MKTFNDLNFIEIAPPVVGVKSKLFFENGYGVSVVCHTFSYGGSNGLYELAILDSDGALTYKTPITSDVLGYLTPEEVTEYMKQVQEL